MRSDPPKNTHSGFTGEVKITWAREQPNEQVKDTLVSAHVSTMVTDGEPAFAHLETLADIRYKIKFATCANFNSVQVYSAKSSLHFPK